MNNIRKKDQKGSITVEACVIVPITVILFMITVCLVLFVYDHMIMKHAAGKLAIRLAEAYALDLEGEDIIEEMTAELEKTFIISCDPVINVEREGEWMGVGKSFKVTISAGIKKQLSFFGSTFFREHSVYGASYMWDLKSYRFLMENGKEITGTE